MKPDRSAMLLSTLFLATLTAPAPAQENAWTSHGPTGFGWVLDLAIADGVAYAGTPNGVFRSHDRGVSWQQSGLKGTSIERIVALSGAPVVLAGNYGEFFSSRDQGETWVPLDPPKLYVAAIDPGHLSTVFAFSYYNNMIWKSTDAGASWSPHSANPSNEPMRGLAFDSTAAYLLTSSSLYKSLDDGVSWALVPLVMRDATIMSGIAPGALYVAGIDGFCRTANSASTWTCSTTTNFYQPDIVEIPDDGPAGSRLFAESYATGAVVVSSDGGTTWTPVTLGTEPRAYVMGLAADASGSLLLAGTFTRLLRSENRGEIWADAGAGLSSVWIQALALAPGDPSTVWAGGFDPGLFRSADSGLSWSRAGGSRSPLYVNSILIDPVRPATMYVGSDAVYRTEDGGETWNSTSPRSREINTLAIDPADPRRVWAGTSGQFQSSNGVKGEKGGGLLHSDDGARTWQLSSLAQTVYSILFDRKPGTIYAGSYYDIDFAYYDYGPLVGEGGSIFTSSDGGATFTKGARRFPDRVLAMAADPFLDNVVYAAAGSVYRSTDAGVTWETASVGLPGAARRLVADPVRPGRLYCAAGGVFRTLDGAQTWQPLSSGFGSIPVSELVISPDGRRLHAGTMGGGVFELDLGISDPCPPDGTERCVIPPTPPCGRGTDPPDCRAREAHDLNRPFPDP